MKRKVLAYVLAAAMMVTGAVQNATAFAQEAEETVAETDGGSESNEPAAVSENEGIEWAEEWAFDFGAADSAVAGAGDSLLKANYAIDTNVAPQLCTGTYLYGEHEDESKTDNHFGFVESVSTGSTTAKGAYFADFVYGADGNAYTFKADVKAGCYYVYVYTGCKTDANTTSFYFGDNITVIEAGIADGSADSNKSGTTLKETVNGTVYTQTSIESQQNRYCLYKVNVKPVSEESTHGVFTITCFDDTADLGENAVTARLNGLELVRYADNLIEDNDDSENKGNSEANSENNSENAGGNSEGSESSENAGGNSENAGGNSEVKLATEWAFDFGPSTDSDKGTPQVNATVVMNDAVSAVNLTTKPQLCTGSYLYDTNEDEINKGSHFGFTAPVNDENTVKGGEYFRDYVYAVGPEESYTFKADVKAGCYYVYVYTGWKDGINTTSFYFGDGKAAVEAGIETENRPATDGSNPPTVAKDNGKTVYTQIAGNGGQNCFCVYKVNVKPVSEGSDKGVFSITCFDKTAATTKTARLNGLEMIRFSDVVDDNEGGDSEGSETKGSETKGSETKGSETEGSETKGSETEGSETKGSETEGSETKGSETKGSETKGSETEGSETNGSEAGGSGEITYKITYVLDKDVTNNNPTNYTSSDKKFALKNPTRKKYLFAGWYTDSAKKNQIKEIDPSKGQNYTLYAKWTKVTVAKPVLKSVKNVKGKKMTVTLKKKISDVAGYQIQYSTNSKFKKANKTATIKKTKTSATIRKLTKKKTYYVRVRAYKLDSTGAKVYGKYSKSKKVKITK